MKNNRRAFTGLEILLGIGVVVLITAVAAPKVAPKLFDGRTREAENSKDASAAVEAAVAKERAANERQGAVVAASLNQMGVAAGQLPDSPQKTFLVREGAFISPLLPAPSPKALLEAERRRVAILEGKLEQADKLYRDAAKGNAELLADNAKLRARLSTALSERREADAALAESAAFQRGKDYAIAVLAAIVVLCVLGWVFARLNGINTRTLGMMSADIRAGHDPQEVLDRYIPVRLWRSVKKERNRAQVEDAT